MSLECLAILGVKNEPLYINAPTGNQGNTGAHHNNDNNDVFGFLEAQSSGLSIRQEVRECIGDFNQIPAPEN